jgi:hypothetical protein
MGHRGLDLLTLSSFAFCPEADRLLLLAEVRRSRGTEYHGLALSSKKAAMFLSRRRLLQSALLCAAGTSSAYEADIALGGLKVVEKANDLYQADEQALVNPFADGTMG